MELHFEKRMQEIEKNNIARMDAAQAAYARLKAKGQYWYDDEDDEIPLDDEEENEQKEAQPN